jgi:hypothetical protein
MNKLLAVLAGSLLALTAWADLLIPPAGGDTFTGNSGYSYTSTSAAVDIGPGDVAIALERGWGPVPQLYPVTQWNPGQSLSAGTILGNCTSGATVAGFCTLGSGLSATGGVLTATGGGGGAVSSVTGSSGVTVSPTTGATVVSLSQAINAQTGTSYTVQASDAAGLITFSNAAATAVTLPAATTTGFGVGFGFDVQNKGAGTFTITPTTSTINGAASLAITSTNGCAITSDGTNYQVSACTAVSPGGSVTPSFTTLTVSSTVSGAGFTSLFASPPSIGTTAPAIVEANQLVLSGNVSCAGALTLGCGLQSPSTVTYTDSSGTGGTIASAYMYALPTTVVAAATTATTYTALAALYVPQPSTGTNVTATNRWSISTAGGAIFGGLVNVNGGGLTATGAVNLNSNVSTTTNIGAGTATGLVTIGSGSNAVKVSSAMQDAVSVVTASGNITVSATAARHICANLSTPAAIAVNLPASPSLGLIYSVDDCAGNAATYNLTVTPAAGSIDGSSTYVISNNYGSWSGYYTGSRWKTVSHQ